MKGDKRKSQALANSSLPKNGKKAKKSEVVKPARKSKAVMYDPMIDPQSDDDDDEDEDEEEEEEQADDIEDDDGVEEFGDGQKFEGLDEDEEDVEGEDEDDEVAKTSASAQSRPTSSAGPSRLYAAPTLAELDALRTASDTGSTTFSLQLDALLSSTLLPVTPPAPLRALLTAIHDLVLSLPVLPGLSPRQAEIRLAGGKKGKKEKIARGGVHMRDEEEVMVPFPGPEELDPRKGEVKWTLGWDKPAEVFVGGAWPVCGGYKKAKGQMGPIDLVVTMPSEIISAKDRMGYRYFHKRVHYLAVIAQAIKRTAANAGVLSDVSVTWDHSDARRPIVVVSAGKGQGLKHAVDVRIHAGIPSDTFALPTLYPTKSLIRSAGADADTEIDSQATPLSATSILRDMQHKSYLLLLNRLSQVLADRTLASFLALWRIWASKRDPASNDEVAVTLLAAVVDGYAVGLATDKSRVKRNRGLGKGLNHWAALRAVWEVLAHTDFATTPMWAGVDEPAVPRDQMVAAFECVLVEPSGGLNVFAGWEKGDVDLIRHHARETLRMLETSPDRFADVFLRSYPPNRIFDEYVVQLIDFLDRIDVSTASKELSLIDRAEQDERALVSLAASVLRRGLGDRCKLVHVTPLSTLPNSLAIGLLLDPSKSSRVLDIGPASDADTEAVESFRELWGDLAELRRFKDGSISESVVWEISRPEDAVSIPARIVAYLVSRHLGTKGGSGLEDGSAVQRANFAPVLELPVTARHASRVAGCERRGFTPIMDAYDQLYRVLKDSDDDLPLSVLSILPVSESLRYSAPIIPHAVDLARAPGAPETTIYLPAHEVVLQFESSPRWPDDVAAVQKLKMALLERMARVVASKIKGAKASVTMDNGEGKSEIDDTVSLTVLLPAGVVFRVRINHERERLLLARALEPPPPAALAGTTLPQPPRRLVIHALALLNTRFIHAPTHHARIAPMHHWFPSFSTASRLLKRWANSHMLSTYLEPQALELLTAKTYLEPGSLGVPGSAGAGFLRTIDMLANWDWSAEALVVPIGLGEDGETGAGSSGRATSAGSAGIAKLKEFRNEVEAQGKNADRVWAIATPDDVVGTRWTGKVTKVVANRVTMLAKATATAAASTAGSLDVTALFRTPKEDYDVLLHLNRAALPRYAEAVDADPQQWAKTYRSAEGKSVQVGYDPAHSFVRDLQRIYGDAMLVFHDQLGGDVVGIVWNPGKKEPRALKPFLGYSTRPAKSKAALVEINKDAIVAEIARLGDGLVQRIERRS